MSLVVVRCCLSSMIVVFCSVRVTRNYVRWPPAGKLLVGQSAVGEIVSTEAEGLVGLRH
jgi:hypothetical protein